MVIAYQIKLVKKEIQSKNKNKQPKIPNPFDFLIFYSQKESGI